MATPNFADEQLTMYQVPKTAGLTHGKGMQSYLCMMAVRLLEMRRVQQEGRCNGCKSAFELRRLEVDHIIPHSGGGTDHIDNLQLLCAHCNRVKGDKPQEYLVARLREMGMAA